MYTVYPKLRAIYSYLPEEEELETLLLSKGVSGFKNRLTELKITERFPIKDDNIEKHFTDIPFSLSQVVLDRLSSSTKEFFKRFIRIYELKDIKSALRRGKGSYLLFIEKDNYSIREIADALSGNFWSVGWERGYSRFKDTQKLLDIENSLDRYYFESLLDSILNLSISERKETGNFIKRWIGNKNILWAARLKKYYGMKTFEIKRFLIPKGKIYENVEEIEKISLEEEKKEFYHFCYKVFKLRMFTMDSILAFFLVFENHLKRILKIYRSKLLDLKKDRVNKLIRVT